VTFADPELAPPAVKLFPRLAATSPQLELKRDVRAVVRECRPAARSDRDTARTQVRARLLRMIVDNERVRRHEQRPNAS
jgi:hypothetical protein